MPCPDARELPSFLSDTPSHRLVVSAIASVPEAVASFECASVEWKLDGIRIQIHRRGISIERGSLADKPSWYMFKKQ